MEAQMENILKFVLEEKHVRLEVTEISAFMEKI